MKSLIEFINESKLLDFEKELIEHIKIEVNYQHKSILEKYGLFDECEDIVNFICSYLSKHYTESIIELTNFSKQVFNSLYEQNNSKINVFFDKLIIHIEKYSTLQMYYDSKSNNYNESTKHLKECNIYIRYNTTNFNSSEFKSMLAHELTHAYEDYNRIAKSEINSLLHLKRNSYFNVVHKLNSKDRIEHDIASFVYLFNKQELNAHIAQFASYLNNYDKKITSDYLSTTLNIIRNHPLYKAYYEIGALIEALDSEYFRKDILDSLVNELNIQFERNMSIEQAKKYLKTNWYKVKRKIENTIPKLVLKYLEDKGLYT